MFPFMIKSFSSRQRLHFREPALHEGTRLTIDHFMSYERFARLSFQMYFDNSVSLPWRSFLMDFVSLKTANSFKERFRNHTKSIKNERHGNETELSKYIWKLKRAKRSYDIKWSIVKRVPSCKAGSRKCNLCLEEKLLIMKGNKANNLLNKRSELFTLCKHITNSHVT